MRVRNTGSLPINKQSPSGGSTQWVQATARMLSMFTQSKLVDSKRIQTRGLLGRFRFVGEM
jgi:hypothetical protein